MSIPPGWTPGCLRLALISDTANNARSITVVAVGPGDGDMLTLQGREALLNADLVLGFTTVLNVVRPWLDKAEVCPMTYRDQEEVLEYAEVRSGRASSAWSAAGAT